MIFGRKKVSKNIGLDRWFGLFAPPSPAAETIGLDRCFSILFDVRKTREPGNSISSIFSNGKKVAGIDVFGGDRQYFGVQNWGGGTLPPLETTAVRTVGKGKGKVNGKVLNSTPGIFYKAESFVGFPIRQNPLYD